MAHANAPRHPSGRRATGIAPGPTARRCTAQAKRALLRRSRRALVAPGSALPSETTLARRWACRSARCGGGRRTGGRAHPDAPPGPRHLRRHAHHRPLPVPVLPRRAQRRAARGTPVELLAFERIRLDDEAAEALGLRGRRPGDPGREPAALQGRPVVHDRIVLPAALFRGLTEKRAGATGPARSTTCTRPSSASPWCAR
jgi:GntR family transcriptional regulator